MNYKHFSESLIFCYLRSICWRKEREQKALPGSPVCPEYALCQEDKAFATEELGLYCLREHSFLLSYLRICSSKEMAFLSSFLSHEVVNVQYHWSINKWLYSAHSVDWQVIIYKVNSHSFMNLRDSRPFLNVSVLKYC